MNEWTIEFSSTSSGIMMLDPDLKVGRGPTSSGRVMSRLSCSLSLCEVLLRGSHPRLKKSEWWKILHERDCWHRRWYYCAPPLNHSSIQFLNQGQAARKWRCEYHQCQWYGGQWCIYASSSDDDGHGVIAAIKNSLNTSGKTIYTANVAKTVGLFDIMMDEHIKGHTNFSEDWARNDRPIYRGNDC